MNEMTPHKKWLPQERDMRKRLEEENNEIVYHTHIGYPHFLVLVTLAQLLDNKLNINLQTRNYRCFNLN